MQVQLMSVTTALPLKNSISKLSVKHTVTSYKPDLKLQNSPYCLPYSSYDTSLENLVLYQLTTP